MSVLKKITLFVPVLWVLTMVVYWFNLDNKAIYYGVRPVLNWWYDRQKRDVRL